LFNQYFKTNKQFKPSKEKILFLRREAMANLVDINSAIEELGLDLDEFYGFVGDLKEYTDEMVPILAKAVKSKDFLQIKNKSHAIKGALANLRFVAAAEIAKELESCGKNFNGKNLQGRFDSFDSCLKASYQEIA
jgi:HPt (histidine-containing phosphotransfer) domain-containing protein